MAEIWNKTNSQRERIFKERVSRRMESLISRYHAGQRLNLDHDAAQAKKAAAVDAIMKVVASPEFKKQLKP